MDPLANLPSWMDRYKASQMVQYRALGYSQIDIAHEVGVSQQTVSRYVTAINESAKAKSSAEAQEFLFALFMVAAGVGLFAALMRAR